ncbi:hypothetical protein B0A49_13343, partial [Cryomyces minteri]
MKKHWREWHQWSVGRKRGRPSRVREKGVGRRVKEACKTVHCQRLFVQGRGSQYFEVRQPVRKDRGGPQAVPTDGDALWADLRNRIITQWADVEKKARTTIEEGERDEVNPWLERTQWQPYLVGLERPDLLECMEEPNSDPKKDKEPVEAAIWEAMDGLARFSQASIIDRIGVFVRLTQICESSVQVPGKGGNSREEVWARLRQKLVATRTSIENKARSTIQEGEADEVSPWLERAQWHQYLVGLERPELISCVEEPNKKEEPVEAAIWEAMHGLVRVCQQSVRARVGVFVRMEAIRTEKHQTRYQPLQPYMDGKALGDYSRPWKQVLMFFARTQKEHGWRSPKYRFTGRQREAWEELVDQAERGVDNGEERAEEEGSQEGEESEEEVEDTSSNDSVRTEEKEDEEEKLSAVQKACLQFCIALLDQRITQKEYDSALVCALAVLGVKEGGWKGPDQYPPILSAMIKIARFVVVQQALELAGPFESDGLDSDSDSDSSVDTIRPRKGCLQFVTEMMDRFMVRGGHGAMQWMLDLRTYGLKIHYNTTSTGNVDWIGDQILFKNMQFGMAEFRSMVHGLVAETRRMLMEDLLFDKQGKDDGVFLQDQRSQLPVNGQMWLFDRVGQDEATQATFIRPGTGMVADRKGIEGYMSQMVEYREKLLVLMHITGGQPARSPEILSIRHSNTAKGEHRNTFIEDGMVVFATRYHKGYALSGDVKIIHRYLPREVVSAKERKAIVEKYARYKLSEPLDVPLPPPLESPIKALSGPVDAFLCEEEECSFISINRSVIGQHCNQAHDWKWKKEDSEHWKKVKAQTFFTGRFRRYFVVHAAEDHSIAVALGQGDKDSAAAIKREWSEARAKRKKELEIADEKVAKTDRTGWFNRTCWPEHLAQRNTKRLAHASRPPDRDERLLQQAMKVVDLAMEKSVAGLSTLAVETRRWLRSAKREEIDVRPMARLQNPESQNR